MQELALDINAVSKVYAGGGMALNTLSLKVEKGDFFGLLGPNGAGKSTLIGIVSSLVRKTSGSIKVFGTDIDENFPKAKSQLGIVPQEFNFNNFEKVYNIITTQAGFYGISKNVAASRAEHYLKMLDLWDKRDSKAMELSGGMKRRLMIVRAMINEPKLLILDEPSAGVDIELRRSMWEMLRQVNEQGTTILLTTHYLEEAESLCRNIGIINHGYLIQNTSVKSLVAELSKETFIFDCAAPISDTISFENFNIEIVEGNSIEVVVDKNSSLNALFVEFDKHQIEIISMRNKVNRLEEMFVSVLADKGMRA